MKIKYLIRSELEVHTYNTYIVLDDSVLLISYGEGGDSFYEIGNKMAELLEQVNLLPTFKNVYSFITEDVLRGWIRKNLNRIFPTY